MKPTFLVLVIAVTTVWAQDLLDPHEMKIKTKVKLKKSQTFSDDSEAINPSSNLKRSESENNAENIGNISAKVVKSDISLILLKRTINLIINSANAEKENPSLFKGLYRFQTDTNEHRFLIQFLNQNSISSDDLRKIDSILSSIFAKEEENMWFNFDIPTEEVLSVVSSTNFHIVMGLNVMALVFYYLIKNNFGFLYILSYSVTLMLAVDFTFRYKFMFEEAEKHNLDIKYSPDCDTAQMNWSDYLKFVLSKKDCERRYVTPLDVGLHQVKYLIIIPLESFGTGMGKFANELWTQLPFPWNFLMFPMMLVFVTLLVVFVIFAIRDTPFKINLLHLLHLQIGRQHDDTNRVAGRTLDRLLDATVHRKMVEDTKTSPPKKNKRKPSQKNLKPKETVETESISNNSKDTEIKDNKAIRIMENQVLENIDQNKDKVENDDENKK